MSNSTTITTSYLRLILGAIGIISSLLIIVYGNWIASDDSSVPYAFICIVLALVSLIVIASSRAVLKKEYMDSNSEA